MSEQKPLAPTARNIKEAWCKAHNKNINRLNGDDYNRIIAYAVEVGGLIGAQETKKIYEQAIKNSTNGGSTEQIQP
jgi:hypothetical protein